ncbi:MAG: cytochrome c [Bacteroidia bacterium]|nr:cytochrome c [Bacteroidia bacterium]
MKPARSRTRALLAFGWPLALLGLLLLLRWGMDGGNTAGRKLYERECQSCHLENGQGLRGWIPPVAGADYVQERGAELACLIVHGISDTLTVNGRRYAQPMPGVQKPLTPNEIAALINYLKTAWGKQGAPVSAPDVARALEQCP